MRILSAAGRLAAICAVALGGCASLDPYQRPGAWHPLGANAANLRVMVADPRDLDAGQGTLLSSGDLGAAAVARLRADRVKPLPGSAVSDFRTGDNTAQPEQASDAPNAMAPVAAPAAQAVSQ